MSTAPGGISCPVLTYHSQNVYANHYGENDHISLAEDLRTLHARGKRVVPLSRLVDALLGRRSADELTDAVCITLDDGCDLDVRDLEFADLGRQQSMAGILADFRDRYADQGQAGVQATTFVIASPAVRQLIDTEALFGKGWISDDWWAVAQRQGLLDVQSHGWDHKHPALDVEGLDQRDDHRFDTVATFEECELQVRRAGDYIARRAQRERPQYFAFPYGSSSRYIRETYLPENAGSLGVEAAFSTTPAHVTDSSDRWNLPRYVCGRDWKTPEDFVQVLEGHAQSGASAAD